jgi:hypothetical protein
MDTIHGDSYPREIPQNVEESRDAVLGARVRLPLEIRGGVNEDDLATVPAARYDDAGIAELIATATAQFYSDFLNRAMDTEVDFTIPVDRLSLLEPDEGCEREQREIKAVVMIVEVEDLGKTCPCGQLFKPRAIV